MMEITREELIAKVEELEKKLDETLDELNWYQVEAVARTNTDGRTKP